MITKVELKQIILNTLGYHNDNLKMCGLDCCGIKTERQTELDNKEIIKTANKLTDKIWDRINPKCTCERCTGIKDAEWYYND